MRRDSAPIRAGLLATALSILSAFLTGTGCRRSGAPAIDLPSPTAGPVAALDLYEPHAVGEPARGQPWITHVNTVDLDRDGAIDILACDAQANTVIRLRPVASGGYEETVLAGGLRAPVHVEPADVDGDGDLDLLVASMGQVFPNNDPIGAVIVLENDGRGAFSTRILLEDVARVTDVRAADFNGDGRADLAVAQFGYDQGEVRWMECTGPWEYESRVLLDLSGAINACVDDMNGDGTPDIVVLVSQQWEEIHLFANAGQGSFTRRKIHGSTNADFGSSGISLCDVNRDGRVDVLYTNGDGFDHATPGPRPWHGVQWLENAGHGYFRSHRIGDLPGAYSPLGVDADADGDIDIVAASAFADWADPGAVSLMLFENDGTLGFAPRILAHAPTHLLSLAVVADGDAAPALVTGGFHAYPPYDRMSRITLWRRR